ncbi:MAG: hypothetical protein Q9M97_06930 [Candidatus Gracilibacteria bacterium]|nr:hypothetical protein [Candidatus Gracilibacteria bacterium]
MNERIRKIEEILLRMSERTDKLEFENEKRAVENEKSFKKMKVENEKSFKKMKVENEKRAVEREKDMKELRDIMKKMGKRLDGMGYTEGQISEEMFSENFEMILNEGGEEIGKVLTNKISYDKNNKKVAEFDIIGVNGTKVFLGEVKTKLTKKHIDKFLEKTLPEFNNYVKTQKYRGLKKYFE